MVVAVLDIKHHPLDHLVVVVLGFLVIKLLVMVFHILVEVELDPLDQ
tara:strand:- start:95 stop:235 length:141 start_codon:yes stop_codon:yes gene_type:complete